MEKNTQEKYLFFKEYYNETFEMRGRLRAELLELTKLNILFYGVFVYFVSQRQQDKFIIDFDATLNWYHCFLILSLVILAITTILLASGLLPVPTRYIASPKELDDHWKKLEDYCASEDVDDTPEGVLKEHMLEQYTDAAIQNDKNNLVVSKFKEYASYCVYLSLFLFYILFSLKYFELKLGFGVFVLMLLISFSVMYIRKKKLNDERN